MQRGATKRDVEIFRAMRRCRTQKAVNAILNAVTPDDRELVVMWNAYLREKRDREGPFNIDDEVGRPIGQKVMWKLLN